MRHHVPLPRYSLIQVLRDGEHPVKTKTSLGGACTLGTRCLRGFLDLRVSPCLVSRVAVALGCITALSILLVANFLGSSSSSVPVYVPVTTSYAALESANAAGDAVSGIDVMRLPFASGLRVAIFAHGPRCGALSSWNSSQLLASSVAGEWSVGRDRAHVLLWGHARWKLCSPSLAYACSTRLHRQTHRQPRPSTRSIARRVPSFPPPALHLMRALI